MFQKEPLLKIKASPSFQQLSTIIDRVAWLNLFFNSISIPDHQSLDGPANPEILIPAPTPVPCLQ